MADNLQNEFNELIRKLRELGATTREIDSMRVAFQGAAGDVEQGRVELDRMRRELTALEAQAAAATLPFSDLTKILAENAAELQSTGQFIGKIGRSFDVVKNIGRDLLNDSIGITDLNRSQLESKLENLKVQRQSLRLAAEEAKHQRNILMAEIARRGGMDAATQTQKNQLKQLDAIIDYNADQDAGLAGIIAKTEQRLDLEDRIEKKMGVTGALVEGTGALMERLGMRSGIFHTAMEKAAQEMRNMSRATEEGVENFTRLQIISKGLSTLFSGFSKALFSLEGAGVAVAQAFLDVNKAATEAVQLTGQNAVFTQGLNDRLATTVQFLETTAELTKQTGMNAQNIFTSDVIAGAAELKNTMGLAANEAGGLAVIAQTTSGDIDGVTDSVVDTTSAFNKANRSAVSQGQILRDVATTSDGIRASFAGMPGAIAKAAATARRLGMELSDLDNIASSLLDFESSIEAELEAQLLLGRQMNLSKARELALNNDLAGVGKEIFKNSASIAEFGRMNRIQQEAQAKALGLTRDQLGKIAYQRALEAGMTADQAAKAAGVNAEEMKRMAIQEKIQMLMGKLAQSFAPILEALVPIVDLFGAIIAPVAGFIGYLAQGVASLLKFKPILTTLKGLVLATFGFKFANFIKGLMLSGQSMQGLTASMRAFRIAQAKGLSDKQILAGFGGKAAQQATQMTIGQTIALKANNAVRRISIMLQKTYTATTNALTAGLTRLIGAERIKAIQSKLSNAYEKVALFLGKSRIAQYIAEKAQLVASTIAKYANVGASAAQTAANTGLATSQTAVATTGAAAGGGLAAAGAGLGAFGAAAAPAIPIILAIGAGLLMASPAIYAFGVAIKSAFEGVAAIVSAVGGVLIGMLDVITLEKAAAVGVMGLSFMSLAAGLGILTASIFTSMPAIGMLGAIALMGPGLMNAGSGIKAMAEGVAKLSEALQSLETSKLEEVKDLITTTAVAAPAVAATGAITSLIQGIAGTGGGNENNMDAKLDELIAAVRSGANVRVYLDSDDITKRTVIESTTLS